MERAASKREIPVGAIIQLQPDLENDTVAYREGPGEKGIAAIYDINKK